MAVQEVLGVSTIGRVKRDRKNKVWRLWLEPGPAHFAREYFGDQWRDNVGLHFDQFETACNALESVALAFAKQPHHIYA